MHYWHPNWWARPVEHYAPFPYYPHPVAYDRPPKGRVVNTYDMYGSYYPSYENKSEYEMTSFPFAYDYQTQNYPYLAQSY